MYERSVIYLIREFPDPHGVFESVRKTEQMVYCVVKSVGHTEVYEALAHGLHPTLVFSLSNYLDYGGELYLRYKEKLYSVIRTYRTGMSIELTCEEAQINV